LIEEAKLGVLTGSFLSAVIGFALLRIAPQHARQGEADEAQEREIDRDGDVASMSKH
jgi:NhaA family Na+:H+ antiporter